LANRRIKRTKSFGSYLTAINQDVVNLQNRPNIKGDLAAGSVNGDTLSSTVTLASNSIQSANFQPGLTGWAIDGTGIAEFSDVYVRGDINAYSGTIGYWNISYPAVERYIGPSRLFGTFLESRDLGNTDIDDTSGTYVGLYKSYTQGALLINGAYRTSGISTITVRDNDYRIGDVVTVVVNEDSSFNQYKAVIISTDNDHIQYIDSGSDVTITTGINYTGTVTLVNPDVSGLYLKDYSKSLFDYGYFSTEGVAYVSAQMINLMYNPSFEYLGSPSTYGWSTSSGVRIAPVYYTPSYNAANTTAMTTTKIGTITNVSKTGSTITYTAANSLTAAEYVSIVGVKSTNNTTGASNTWFNYSNVAVATANSTAFTVTSANATADTYSTSNGLYYSLGSTQVNRFTISGVSVATNTITYTTSAVHNLVPGEMVRITATGGTNLAYNNATVFSTPATNTFTVVAAGAVATGFTTGTVTRYVQNYSTAGSAFGGSYSSNSIATTSYVVGTVDYAKARSYGIFDVDKSLYLNLHMFEQYQPESLIITATPTVSSGGLGANVVVTTPMTHGLAVNDLVYVDFTLTDDLGISFVPTGGVAKVTAIGSTTTFTYSVVSTVAGTTYTLGTQSNKDGTARTKAVYKVFYPAMDLKEVFIKFPNAASYSVTSIPTASNGVTVYGSTNSLNAGDYVSLTGATTDSLNGLYQVYAANSTTFTVMSNNTATTSNTMPTATVAQPLYPILTPETQAIWDGYPSTYTITSFTSNGTNVTFNVTNNFTDENPDGEYSVIVSGISTNGGVTNLGLNGTYYPPSSFSSPKYVSFDGTTLVVPFAGSITSGIGFATMDTDDRVHPAHYLTMDPAVYMPELLDPLMGITPYDTSIAGINSLPVISSLALDAAYSKIDPVGYAAKSNFSLYIPGWQYAQQSANIGPAIANDSYIATDVIDRFTYRTQPTTAVSRVLTRYSAQPFTLIFDDTGFSTSNRSFYGDQGSQYSWLDSTLATPEQISIQSPTQWLDVELGNQYAALNSFDYIGMNSKYFSKSLNKPGHLAMNSSTYEATYDGFTDSQVLRLSAGEQLAETFWNSSKYYVYTEAYSTHALTENNPTSIFGSVANWSDEKKYGSKAYRREESSLITNVATDSAITTTLTAKKFFGTTKEATLKLYVDNKSPLSSPASSATITADSVGISSRLTISGTGADDVALGATNHPPFQVGNSYGANIAMDANEFQARNGATYATLYLNNNGGSVGIGKASATNAYGYTYIYNAYDNDITATRHAMWISSAGQVGWASSSRTRKQDIVTAAIDPKAVLSIEPKFFRYIKEVELRGDEAPIEVGMIAEDLHDAGLTHFVDYNDDGSIQGIHYTTYVVALQAVVRDLSDRLQKIEDKLNN
jgi:hypothetical protein